ncbi:QacE family quaternary ammonium compound efflux SMR transporter [Bacillus sp. FJAT-42376]|uniref:DMT family transporter n=1 Tax=Bacillus sp. FJAT-42376 TaxID=2014076 RepID=UPI000F4E6C71|nr:multidrug efflux SMR transporter [Bacillus sp. FJAT-42376]AZB41633.1 QacE family quaternary ammonium compound efflux SMR transporter [Bacillus sp. FJAT-42376]
MAWFVIVAAGLFEMLGVVLLNRVARKRSAANILLLAVSFMASFTLLSIAMKSLPMGTAYAIWTGIGAAGGAVLGMILYGESKDWQRILFIALILGSTIGLKIIA